MRRGIRDGRERGGHPSIGSGVCLRVRRPPAEPARPGPAAPLLRAPPLHPRPPEGGVRFDDNLGETADGDDGDGDDADDRASPAGLPRRGRAPGPRRRRRLRPDPAPASHRARRRRRHPGRRGSAPRSAIPYVEAYGPRVWLDSDKRRSPPAVQLDARASQDIGIGKEVTARGRGADWRRFRALVKCVGGDPDARRPVPGAKKSRGDRLVNTATQLATTSTTSTTRRRTRGDALARRKGKGKKGGSRRRPGRRRRPVSRCVPGARRLFALPALRRRARGGPSGEDRRLRAEGRDTERDGRGGGGGRSRPNHLTNRRRRLGRPSVRGWAFSRINKCRSRDGGVVPGRPTRPGRRRKNSRPSTSTRGLLGAQRPAELAVVPPRGPRATPAEGAR